MKQLDNKLLILYNNLKKQGYLDEWINLYFYKKYKIDITEIDEKQVDIKEIRTKQKAFRNMIIDRDKKCIISGFDPKECEAAHIIPYAICKTYERSNGILLNLCLHKLFDDYIFSINPNTFKIEIKNNINNLSICNYKDKIVKIPRECINNMMQHYKTFCNQNNI